MGLLLCHITLEQPCEASRLYQSFPSTNPVNPTQLSDFIVRPIRSERVRNRYGNGFKPGN